MILALLLLAQSFGEYPATDSKFEGKPAVPVLKTAFQRRFRTMIREEAAKGPNFDGHYTVAQWGCGAGCISGALVDARTGEVSALPFEFFTVSASSPLEPIQFRLDSRLVKAEGCLGESTSKCGRFAWEWDGKMRKWKSIPVTEKSRK